MPLPPAPPKLFTLYGLKRPDENIIRYFGITSVPLDRRLKNHIRCKGENLRKDRWISKMAPLRPELVPYAVELTLEQACELEIDLIKSFRESLDLINLTDGGEGNLGVSPSPETREKLRMSQLGKKKPISAVEKMRGQKRPEQSLRMLGNTLAVGSKGWVGKKHTPEAREKMRKAQLGNQNARKK